MTETPSIARPDLYTRNQLRETDMFGLCPTCQSPLAKTLSGNPGMHFLVVCPAGHTRDVEFDRETRKWAAQEKS